MTQRLIGAGLVGTERTAALQNQDRLRFCRRAGWRGRLLIHGDDRSIDDVGRTVAALHRGVNRPNRGDDHA
jgi:hypothetical protein